MTSGDLASGMQNALASWGNLITKLHLATGGAPVFKGPVAIR